MSSTFESVLSLPNSPASSVLIWFSFQTDTNLSIFKLQSAVGNLFREFLTKKNFIEIHTPKLQGAATESGASVFKVAYFDRSFFLC